MLSYGLVPHAWRARIEKGRFSRKQILAGVWHSALPGSYGGSQRPFCGPARTGGSYRDRHGTVTEYGGRTPRVSPVQTKLGNDPRATRLPAPGPACG